MKTKLLLSLIACGFVIGGVDAMQENADQWATKARKIEAIDMYKTNASWWQDEVIDTLAGYLDADEINMEKFSGIICAILDSVNDEKPEEFFKTYWGSEDRFVDRAIMIDGTTPSTYMLNNYNANVTQDTVNAFLRDVIAARDQLEAVNPHNQNVVRLTALARVLIATDIPEFVKAFTPALVLLRDRILQVLRH